MKIRYALLAAALGLLLAGCQAKEPEGGASPEPGPSQAVTVPSPLPETPTLPPETPVPTSEEPEPSPFLSPLEQLLAEQPMDDDHDAFLVDTNGKLGTLLVTVERGEQVYDGCSTTLSVWDPQEMDKPIQEMEKTTYYVLHWHEELDANFDGYMDFSYMYAMGNQPNYWYLWIWDEEAGQFVEEPEYSTISGPRVDPETQVIDGWARNSAGGDGVTTFHRWEDGELVCIRRIETGYDYENRVYDNYETSVFASWIRVEDRIDGELTEVYYRYYAPDEGTSFFSERMNWEDLDYHGETWKNT